MKTLLTHPFLHRCIDRSKILTGCDKLNTFLNRIEKQSVDRSIIDANAYKGDALELFTEALIKLSPMDKRIGIFNYQPIEGHDTGVDGHGTGFNLKPAAVQVKWRTADYILTANEDHLSNFVMTANNKFGVDVNDRDNLLIVTTARGIHHYTDIEMFDKKVRTIHRDHLRQLVDLNGAFWTLFARSWEESLAILRQVV